MESRKEDDKEVTKKERFKQINRVLSLYVSLNKGTVVKKKIANL